MAEPQKISINISTMALVKIVIFALLVFALYVVRDILIVLLISIVLASAMDPLVDWLYRKAKFPRGVSVILVYLVFVSFFVSVIYFLIPPIVQQFAQLGGRLEGLREELQDQTSKLSRVMDQL